MFRYIAHDYLNSHTVIRRDLISITPDVAGELGSIRLDVLQAAALMELLYPVKHTTFSTETDLMQIMVNNPYAFSSCYSINTRSSMHPVMLVMIIVS